MICTSHLSSLTVVSVSVLSHNCNASIGQQRPTVPLKFGWCLVDNTISLGGGTLHSWSAACCLWVCNVHHLTTLLLAVFNRIIHFSKLKQCEGKEGSPKLLCQKVTEQVARCSHALILLWMSRQVDLSLLHHLSSHRWKMLANNYFQML